MKLTSLMPARKEILTSSLIPEDDRGSGRLVPFFILGIILGTILCLPAWAGERDEFPGNLNCCTTAGCNCK